MAIFWNILFQVPLLDFAFVFWFVVGCGRKNDGDGNAIWRQMREMAIT